MMLRHALTPWLTVSAPRSIHYLGRDQNNRSEFTDSSTKSGQSSYGDNRDTADSEEEKMRKHYHDINVKLDPHRVEERVIPKPVPVLPIQHEVGKPLHDGEILLVITYVEGTIVDINESHEENSKLPHMEVYISVDNKNFHTNLTNQPHLFPENANLNTNPHPIPDIIHPNSQTLPFPGNINLNLDKPISIPNVNKFSEGQRSHINHKPNNNTFLPISNTEWRDQPKDTVEDKYTMELPDDDEDAEHDTPVVQLQVAVEDALSLSMGSAMSLKKRGK